MLKPFQEHFASESLWLQKKKLFDVDGENGKKGSGRSNDETIPFREQNCAFHLRDAITETGANVTFIFALACEHAFRTPRWSPSTGRSGSLSRCRETESNKVVGGSTADATTVKVRNILGVARLKFNQVKAF